MFEKIEILAIIIVLLLLFYLVISLGARVSKNSPAYHRVSKYLFGVRILISIIAIVSLILWALM
jgi:amino acid transporter